MTVSGLIAAWTEAYSSMGTETNKKLVSSLTSRIRAYERFFKEKEKREKEKKTEADAGVQEPNNAAHSAYVNLVKLLNALDKDSPGSDTSGQEELTRQRVKEILQDVYGINTEG